jgi:hypothetical protein
VPGLTEKQIEETRALAIASALAQGLPERVQDPAILQRVAALVRPGLAAPDGGDPGGIEGVAAGSGGGDDSVVEGCGDDRGLAA